MRNLLLAAGAVALIGLAVEPAALARLLLGAGMPGLAARVSDDPAWRGTALYAAGRYAEAAQAFSKSPYNRGNALALAGDLKGRSPPTRRPSPAIPRTRTPRRTANSSRASSTRRTPPAAAPPGRRTRRPTPPPATPPRPNPTPTTPAPPPPATALPATANRPPPPIRRATRRPPAPAGPSSGRSIPAAARRGARPATRRAAGARAAAMPACPRWWSARCAGSRRASRRGRSARTGTGSRP